MTVTRSRFTEPEGTPSRDEPLKTAPQSHEVGVAGAPKVEKAKPSRIAKVFLVVGLTNRSHGKLFVRNKPQTIVDEDLIEEFRKDGNFVVEMLSVTGGSSAGTK